MAKTSRTLARRRLAAENLETVVQILLHRWVSGGRENTIDQALNAVAAERTTLRSTTVKQARRYVRELLRTVSTEELLHTVLPVAISRATDENILMPRRWLVGEAALLSIGHDRLAREWAERVREGELPQDALPSDLDYVVESTDPLWDRLGWLRHVFADELPEGIRTRELQELYDVFRASLRELYPPAKRTARQRRN
jgi:hypothetical protein